MGKRLLAITALAMLLGSGCASEHSAKPLPADRGWAKTAADPVMYDPIPSTGRAPVKAAEPAPKPAPAPAPAPAAAPVAAAPTGSSSCMAFPTGDRASSALEVCQIMPAEVRAGQAYEYQICVENLTNATLQNVAVMAEGFKNLAVVSSNPASTGGANGSLIWNFGDLAPHAKRCVTVNARADAVGVSSACVSATYNNLLCAATNVVQPALKITKTATPEVMLCDVITYTIEVTNTGNGAANNVRVKDTLPAGLATLDGKTALDLDAGTLNGGQSKTMTVQVKASKSGRYENAASASADGGLSAQSNTVATVVKQPVLTIKAECGNTILIGRDTTAKFTIKNTGDGACNGTVVTAKVPANATFKSADNGGVNNGGTVTWNAGNVGPGESRTYSITVNGGNAGELKFDATASCACATQVADSCTTSIKGSPDLGTLLTDDNGVVNVGDPHVYRYEVTNQGQVNLTNIVVVVELPAEIDYISCTLQPSKVEGKKLTFTIPSLATGGRTGFNLTAKANKAGEFVVISTTTSNEVRSPVRDDEVTNYIDR